MIPLPRCRQSPPLGRSTLRALLVSALAIVSASSTIGCGRGRHHWGRSRPAPSSEAVPSRADDDEPVALPSRPAPPSAPVAAAPPPAAAPAPPRLPWHARPVAPPRKHVPVSPPPAPAGPPSTCGPRGRGLHYAVRGVVTADVLNIREKPDWKSAITGLLPPDATGITATPERARSGGSTWRLVTCGKISGWVNERFLAVEGSGAAAPPAP
jgi:hypothetical protein